MPSGKQVLSDFLVLLNMGGQSSVKSEDKIP